MKNRLVVAIVVVVAAFAAGCGGSDVAEQVATDTAGTAAEADQAASDLIAQLGSDQAAADALIIAMDRGYSGSQILDGVDASDLRDDGTIDGQSPAGPPLNLVLYDLDGEGEDAIGADDGSGGDVVLASFFQVQKTPIDRLRENATRNLGVGEPATDQILRLLKAGFQASDVIEILIFGIDADADHPEEPDGPIGCVRIVDEIYCPFGERFRVPAEADPAQDTPEQAQDTAPVEPEIPTGPVTFTGSASQGAIENENSDDLRSAEFTATIDGSTVVMQVTMIAHAWHRGGYEEQFVDQNCGSTVRHVLRFEGPTGNPTDLRATVEASEILEVQGVLCDDDDAERNLLAVRDMQGRFRGQANGLGIEGTLEARSLPLEISAN